MGWRRQIVFGPFQEVCLMSDYFIMSLPPMIVIFSPEGVFGAIRFPLRVTFFAWLAALGKIITMELKKT
jgi:hypothetical protein